MRRYLPALATIVGAPALLRIAYGPSYLNYDAAYSLLWARDIAHGWTPDYDGFIAPTPHPLATAVSFLALPFKAAADDLIIGLIMLCFGAVIWLTYRLGEKIFSLPVGAFAAFVVFTRPVFHKNALVAYQDIPFVMFVLAAVLLEIKQPRRGAPVLVLLGLAGLLRPEAWVLAGLYFLYLWPQLNNGGRVRMATLAAAGPVLWACSDWAITGDPLHSFHGTKDLAAQLNRPTGADDAPYWTAKFLGFTLREPLMIGVPLGIAFAWLHRRNRNTYLLIAAAAAMTAVFMVSAVAGLPLIARYVLTPAVMLAIFYAAAVLGWLELPHGRARTVWTAIGVGLLAIFIAFIPKHVSLYKEFDRKTHNYNWIQADLRDMAVAPAFGRHMQRCGNRLSTTDHRPVPMMRYWTELPPGEVQSGADPEHPWADLIMYPKSLSVAKKYYDRLPDLTPRAGYKQVFTTTAWRLYASPRCQFLMKQPDY